MANPDEASSQAKDLGEITVLLKKWRDGDSHAENELFRLVLPNLRRLAHYLMARERKGHTMQATELVDQVYFRLVAAKDRDWQSRSHFFAIAGRAMRRHLIDYARGRPDAEFVELAGLENLLPVNSAKTELALHIDRLLEKMGETQPEWVHVVELKYFLGLTDEEGAEALGLKLRTFQRIWSDARAWLFEQMQTSNAIHGPKATAQ